VSLHKVQVQAPHGLVVPQHTQRLGSALKPFGTTVDKS
jgi:hypothetical protein